MGFYNIVNSPSMVAGQPEDVGQVLANFQAIQAILNGGIDDVNIRSTAAINPSKFLGYPSDPTKVLGGDGVWRTQVPYGIALPASPVDGQVFCLVDSLTVPTYDWCLRYNAGATGPNKWEFIGGSALTGTVPGSNAMAGGWANYNPTVTAPRSGVYMVSVTVVVTSIGAAGLVGCSAAINAAPQYPVVEALATVSAGSQVSLSFNPTPFSVVGGQNIAVAAYTAVASNISLVWLSVVPKALS
jgi:hypothetical protein